ncbi:MAG: ABC transporter ATP-binding protein [bacterium]
MAESVLKAKAISHSYQSGPAILDDLEFSLNAGETVAIQGRSGVGKTTLLEILGTMREPNEGSVQIGDESVYDLSLSDRAALRGRYIGFVFQEGLLLPDLTLWENCRLAVQLSQRSWSLEKTRKRFEFLMERLGLDPERGNDQPAMLSTGERQRLAVVRALMHGPSILAADEPTGNLDPDSSAKMVDLMLPLAREDETSILIATHDRELADHMETLYRLDEGKLKNRQV